MKPTQDPLSPEHSPVVITRKTGVRRVNNLPIILLAGVVIAFVVMMIVVATDRANKQDNPDKAQAPAQGNTTMFANEIAGNGKTPNQALIPPAMPPLHSTAPGTEPADLSLALGNQPILIARPDNPDQPPPPPGSGNLRPQAQDEEALRIRTGRMQTLEEAIKAKTAVQVTAPRNTGSAPSGTHSPPANRGDMLNQLAAVRQQIEQVQRDDPTAAYQARLAQIRGVGGSAGAPSSPMDSGRPGSPPQLLPTGTGNTGTGTGGIYGAGNMSPGMHGRNSLGQFQGKEPDHWKLDSEPQAPRTPFELRAGFVVPATLISGINSELPGQIMAQVSQNVYDTPTGKYLLIPQGSRLVGAYSSDVAYGQSRVLVAWQRIVFPDGKAMDIGAMPGADSAGFSGFNDQVNNHYLRLFGSAFLMSGVTAGITLSQDRGGSNTGDRQRASDALSEALGQQLGQVTAQLIAKNLNISPTLEIRPGYRFNVIVTKDMTFSKPYESFDY